jgi:hypothetical protein
MRFATIVGWIVIEEAGGVAGTAGFCGYHGVFLRRLACALFLLLGGCGDGVHFSSKSFKRVSF